MACLDGFLARVRPVDCKSLVIDSQRIRPANVGRDEKCPVLAVHVGAFDAGLLAPVGPEHKGFMAAEYESARFVEAGPQ